MSERKWTDPQRHSIEARGGSVLVSAAAGSGKTAVLIERVIRRITDEHDPVDVNRLLVVTFTRAAAAEMRQRLSDALAKKIAEHPEDERYQKQQLLLPQAAITTVDGFCAQLLRQQAANAGLPPRFKVAEESEAALLAARALDEVLEESYTARDPAFLALATQLGGRRDDSGLREAVQQAYTFMQAQPFPEKWLEEQLNAYTEVIPLEDTRWMVPIWRELTFTLGACAYQLSQAAQRATECGLTPYADHLRVEQMQLENLQIALHQGEYDARIARLTAFSFGRLPAVKSDDAVQQETKEFIQKLRTNIKKKITKLLESLYTSEEIREDLAALAPMAEALGDLVRRYTERYTRLKRQKKLLDYNDLEHECLRLLLDGETGERTPLARELSLQYDDIMVDEYQDTNAAQDALFRALSRDERNLFMVGDVKQSIYGFRLAMPEIFTRRRDAYTPYDPEDPQFPATITLENNFRSRETVTDAVNFLFRQLMQADVGGVDYDEREALVYSANYDEADGFETEWLLLDKAQASGECPSNEVAEARAIARRIREQMDTLSVRTKDGIRPLEYGDICILLRYRRTMPIYIKELTRLGIPVGAEGSGSLLSTPEIRTALALLRTIDNPLREIELTALMMSPLYGFTADDCARLRLLARGDEKKEPLYTVLTQVAQGERAADEALVALCRRLISDLRRFRTLAVSLPADRLLERLYRDTALTAVFAARAGGRQRLANLHQLDRVARGFEQDGFRGLSAFVRHIDRLEEQGKDLAAGNSVGGNSVRLMTVHGSKGLEYPVVYLARLGGQFNNDDARKKLLFHDTVGIGLCRLDEQAQTKGRTLPFTGVLAARQQDERAEELRVWYVAMTRAKEKLCIVLTERDLDKKIEALEAALTSARVISPESILHAVGPADWFLSAALRHPSFAFLRHSPDTTVSMAAKHAWRVEVLDPSSLDEETVVEVEEIAEPDEELTALLKERLAYAYPYAALARVPAKVAASQLSHENMSRQHIAAARPDFLQKDGMSAAQRGTALHTFMQFADYPRAATDSVAETQRLVAEGFLTPHQAEVLPQDKINRFFTSELYARMRRSPDCRREFHFTVTVPADAVTDEPLGCDGEEVLVQGIADCVFCEGDGLVLLDYKTDRVREPQELIDRYRSQLQFYKQALEQIFDLPVTQAVLYSFHLGTTVEVVL